MMKNMQKDDTGGDKSYFRWDDDMDLELGKSLRVERNLGNVGSDGKLKTSAYKSAARNLSVKYTTTITMDNIKNRLKSWKKIYSIISNILSQNGSSWDSSKQMITIDDEEFDWDSYVGFFPEAKPFRRKVIPNWEHIAEFCSKERATDITEATPLDAIGVMLVEDGNGKDTDSSSNDQSLKETPRKEQCNNQSNSTSSTQQHHHHKRKSAPSIITSSPLKKLRRIDKMEEALTNLANSMAVYFDSKPKGVDIDDLYNTVRAIPELNEDTFFRICNWLMEDENKFRFLKKLPADKRRRYVLRFMR